MIGLSAAPGVSKAAFTEVFSGYGVGRASSGGIGRDRLRAVVEDIVAWVFEVDPALLRLPNRGRANVALARQVAMYISHIGYGLNLTDVGVVFERDRTTVAHACSVVELRREDPEFDAAILLVEHIIRALSGADSRIPLQLTGGDHPLVSGTSPGGDSSNRNTG